MSEDIVADALNKIMNAKRASKSQISVKMHSKFLISILAIGKLHRYIKDYRIENNVLNVELGERLNACKAIKPRYLVRVEEIMKYVRRYLPARDMGVIVVSTNKGLMTHQTAIEKNIGGSIIAYFY